MKKKFLNNSINLVKKNYPSYDDEKLEVIAYGLEALYLTITKLVIIFLASYLLGILKETLLLTILYNIIRFTAFGLHADKSIQCLIMSSTMFIGGTLLCLNIKINLIVKVILAIICIILLLKYAPADTHKRPIISKKRRLIYKTFSTILGIIFTVLIIIFDNKIISNFLLIGMIESVLMILPISYKLLNLPYNNYKTYNSGLSN